MPLIKVGKKDIKLLESCIDFYIATYRQEPWEDDLDSKEVMKYFRSSLENGADILVYESNNRILSIAIILKVISYASKYIRIEDICVDCEYQKSGYGSRFLKEIEDFYLGSYDVILLNTVRGIPAEKFYKKNNYLTMVENITMYKELVKR